jgi:hypothetical protein
MSLVSYDPDYRLTWMFPRPKRYIEPWKMTQIVQLFTSFPVVLRGNRQAQDRLYDAMEELNIKSIGSRRDPNDGGTRTYRALLKCLGLVFEKDRKLFPTIAGEALSSGEDPIGALQSVLLRHQYPSDYAHRSKIHPEIKIKPFLFILKFLHDAELEYQLTTNELAIVVAYGHNDDCYSYCKEKILCLRNGGEFRNAFNNIQQDLVTPRSSDDIALRLRDVKDIANTAKNYLQASHLITVIREGRTEEVFTFNEEFENLYQEEMSAYFQFIPFHLGYHESFQRSYGRFRSQRDNRSFSEINSQVSSTGFIKSLYVDYAGKNIFGEVPEDFVSDVSRRYGFSAHDVIGAVESIESSSRDIFESNYLHLAQAGKHAAIEFEIATKEIFCKNLPYYAEHTGQRVRNGSVGGYSDIFLIPLNQSYCAIVDTKASPSYTISSNDYAKMVSNYIPNYRELCPPGLNLQLKFCLYVASGFSRNNDHKQQELFNEKGVYASRMTAKNLLKLTQSAIAEDEGRLEALFSQNKELTSSDFF